MLNAKIYIQAHEYQVLRSIFVYSDYGSIGSGGTIVIESCKSILKSILNSCLTILSHYSCGLNNSHSFHALCINLSYCKFTASHSLLPSPYSSPFAHRFFKRVASLPKLDEAMVDKKSQP